MNAIINTKLILEDSIIYDGAITFENGVITQLGKTSDVQIPEGANVIDAQGLYTAPGLIDIHNHGGCDYTFYEDPRHCCEFFLPHGETTVLPTFYSSLTAELMIEGYQKIKALEDTPFGPMLGGLYMEGPYMAAFGSNQKYILWGGDIDRTEYAPVLEALAGYARIWAIDPARPGIEGFMQDVKAADPNAIFTMGHSKATAAQCRKVKKYGLKLQTHHNDSGKAPGRAQGTMGAGCDEFALYDPDIYAELICDENGIHVDPELIRMVVRTKGVERIILITDHMADKDHFTNNEEEGILYGPDLNYDYEGHLAGSHLTLDNACRNLMAHSGYGLCHAIRMATLNPARLLGIEDRVGSLEEGKKANLILIDDMIHVEKVFLEGQLVAEQGRLLV